MEAMKRYEELGMAEALSRSYDYPLACHELALILRCAYAQLPKALHSLLLRDTLAAFRLLPVMQTSHGLSAANLLLQAAEAALPKQKKALAVAEFKHAVVAHKRRCRVRQEGGPIQLPQDILIHIFKFLDMRALVTSSSVCWAWNAAANDNNLWQLQYSLFFGFNGIFCKSEEQTQCFKDECPKANLDWKEAFRRKYTGNSSWRFKSNRAFCGHCKSIIWLSNVTCDRPHHCATLQIRQFKIKPLAPYKEHAVHLFYIITMTNALVSGFSFATCQQRIRWERRMVVEYLLGETMLTSSSDSDSDAEESTISRLWACPKLASSSDFP